MPMSMSSKPGSQNEPDQKPLFFFPQLNPNPVIGVNPSGRVTFLSEGATRALESLGKGASPEVFLPKDMGEILAALKQPERATFRREVTVGDRVFDESICVAPEHGVVGIYATDITERRRTEQTLRESEERFRLLLHQASDAIYVHELDGDRAGRFLEVNESVCRMLGYSREEMLAMEVSDIRAPGSLARMPEIISKLRARGSLVFVTENRTKDGRTLPFEVNVSLFDLQGRTVVLAIARDITERKQAEAELLKYRNHLEELVAARTSELESANRELGAFSYSVSHDLRAPLRAINGFAQALMEDCAAQLDTVGRGYLDRVRAASRRMAELIDHLLNLARIARLPLERKPVNLSELARTIAGELREAEPTRQVELVIQDGMTAQADPVLAGMVLRNLMDNAWKFTGKHPTARIEVGETVRDGEPVWFVRDDGAGFDMAYVDNLFAPFQRLHSTADFAGTGIGLATIQRIVRRHGGRGWIEGAVEKGVTYYFTFAVVNKET